MARKTSKRTKTATAAPKPVSRREAGARLLWVGVGAVGVLGIGSALALDFRGSLREGDLSRIGQGVPSIVQIHDPGCALCRDLQRETRAALKAFDPGVVDYLVANIQTLDGADFQAEMGLPNVSLVLFDGTGTRVAYVQGVTPRAELEEMFRAELNL